MGSKFMTQERIKQFIEESKTAVERTKRNEQYIGYTRMEEAIAIIEYLLKKNDKK